MLSGSPLRLLATRYSLLAPSDAAPPRGTTLCEVLLDVSCSPAQNRPAFANPRLPTGRTSSDDGFGIQLLWSFARAPSAHHAPRSEIPASLGAPLRRLPKPHRAEASAIVSAIPDAFGSREKAFSSMPEDFSRWEKPFSSKERTIYSKKKAFSCWKKALSQRKNAFSPMPEAFSKKSDASRKIRRRSPHRRRRLSLYPTPAQAGIACLQTESI